MPQVTLSAKVVASAKAPKDKDREFYWDAKLSGFGLMITANGARSYVIQYRAAGISRRMTISGARSFGSAKQEAKRILGTVADGGDPMADKRKQRDARADTLRHIVETEYLADGDVKALRSAKGKLGTFERYIFPTLGSRPVAEIKRSEIVRMLGKVKQINGPGAANNAYKILARFFTWYVPRADDDFRSPIVRGTFEPTQGDGARALSDDEIRILWNVASEGRNPFDHMVRFLLLTATRRTEAASMPRSELAGTEWTIPAHRYKGQDGKSAHAHLIPLSPLALEVLAKVPVLNNSKWVFTTNGLTPVSGFSKFKQGFDRRLLAALDQEGDKARQRIVDDLNHRYPGKGYQPFDAKFTTHSLRKTARTLLSRIGIEKSIAEKCLGHIEGGIVGTYDHHETKPQKRVAFESLAREIERIVTGKADNVVPLARA